ncbi:7TM domain-containing protein [Patescibacteria group bacterium]
MFKKLILIPLLFVYLLSAFTAFAQAETETTESPTFIGDAAFTAVINASDSVQLNKNIIFDATKSTHPDVNANIAYSWDFGDGNKKEGAEVVHTFTELGPKTVTLIANDGIQTQTATKDIFVHKKIIILITDRADLKERIEGFTNYANDRDNEILVYESYDSATEFITEEVLERKLSENIDSIRKIDEIVVWTEGNSGLNALSRVKQNQAALDPPLTFDKKTILVLKDADESLGQLQRQFELLKPDNIIVAKEAAFYALIDSPDTTQFIERLTNDGYEFNLINQETSKLQLWNFMSYFVNYLIDSGIPANTVILILMLPVIATIISFMKQIVGLTTFGVYTPTIITLTFWILGLKFGILTLIIIFLVGTGARFALRKFRLLYVPKMAIVLTTVALSIFALLIISIRFNLFDAQFFSLSIFPMLILSTLTEKFINVQSGKGFKRAMILTLQTVLVAIVAYIAIGGEIDLFLFKFKFSALQGFMLSYPEIILVIIIINILLGRWAGLRLLEYVRFREVLRHVEEE